MKAKNRIYLPAMHLALDKEYQVTDQILAFYADQQRPEDRGHLLLLRLLL